MITIKTDAAFQSKTNQGGIGIVIQHNQLTELIFHVPYVENNHILEFKAINLALTYCLEHFSFANEMVVLYSDSKIAIDSINKSYAKDKQFRMILSSILAKTEKLPLFYCDWIPEAKNKRTDQLAKQGLHRKGNYFLVEQN